jgi:hypothetical protein
MCVNVVTYFDKMQSLDLIKFVKSEVVIDANRNYQEVSQKNLEVDPLICGMLCVSAFHPALISEKSRVYENHFTYHECPSSQNQREYTGPLHGHAYA